MRIWSLCVALILSICSAASAQERLALVIGNSDYQAVTTLDNAANDANLIAGTLTNVGFDVTLLVDVTQSDLKRAIADFGRSLRAAGPETVGLFYYAGHGVQSFGANYLLPVDAELYDAADLDLVALEAASVLRQMASAKNRSNIVILDACRNNPFEDILDLNDNGLAEMKAPTGTFLAYATAPGAVALDGRGANSPFTASLADAMQVEGLPIEQMFKQVRVDVLELTQGAQTPWDTSSLTQNFSFRPTVPLTAEEIAEKQLWESVEQSRDPVQLMLFLRSYPGGQYEESARALLAETMAQELDLAGTETEPEPEPVTEAETQAEPEPAQPTSAIDDQAALMEIARASGRREDYQAYLDAFPEGIFAELVKIEIAGIDAKASTSSETETAVAEPNQAESSASVVDVLPVLFDSPLTRGVPEIIGKTISQVASSSPLFPPIDDLPEELWKEQQCSNCHTWTREDLCDQAQVYAAQELSRAIEKLHPFGGSYKENLRNWGLGGCQ